jgi:hypothetical protein
MQTQWISAGVLFSAILASAAANGGDGPQAMPDTGYYSEECDACDPCGGHRHHYGHRYWRDQRLSFNCGCNGSYKFPVPPLYTYHWPGMYSAQTMTEYRSPWRFPPLKPFVDEIPVESLGQLRNPLRPLQPASAIVAWPSQPASHSFSSHVEQLR